MANQKVLVSIVVPICNVEKYLRECLNSCRKQTLKDIEIICVDDGSKDSSLKIAKSFARRDKRFKCISKPNAGYGNTLNVGMQAAKGEYVGIVESDDFVANNMFETLYKEAHDLNLDVVKSDYYTFSTNKGSRQCAYECTCTDNKYYNKVLKPKNTKELFTFHMNTWTGIYRNQFLKENNIKHNETPGASYQDNGFWFQTLSLAKTVMFINKAFYYYRQDNPNSSINSKAKVFCMNDEYKFIYDFMQTHPEVKKDFASEYYRKKFFNYMHTYNRISEEYKLPFLERFAQEFGESIKSKDIDFKELKDNWIRNMCMRIVDNYRMFYYEDSVYRMEQQLTDARSRLTKVINSEEYTVGTKYVDKIKKMLGK